MKKIFATIILVFVLYTLYPIPYTLYPNIVFAAPAPLYPDILPQAPITNPQEIVQPGGLLTRYVNWLIGIFWVVTIAFIIWAAFTFLTANGEEDKITLARKRVQYAVVAAIIAALATGIDLIVYYFLRGVI